MSTAKLDFSSFVLFFNVNESAYVLLHTVKHVRDVRFAALGLFTLDWRKFPEFHVRMPQRLVYQSCDLGSTVSVQIVHPCSVLD